MHFLPIFALLLASPARAEEAKTFTSENYETNFSTGLRPGNGELRFARRFYTSSEALVPGKFSLRGKAGPVENQGACGSCWAFSLTTVLRGTLIQAGKDPGRLSFNYLLNCNREMRGCEGGTFAAAASFTTPLGAPAYGSDGPYEPRQGDCLPRPRVASAIRFNMLGDFVAGPSFRDIAYVLGVMHRPVSVDVATDANWRSYKSGIYNACSKQDINLVDHMVSIEGYDCEKSVDKSGNCLFDKEGNLPPGVGLWIVRNSWGTRWGDKGYITTKATDLKGLRCNAIGHEALYFDPEIRTR